MHSTRSADAEVLFKLTDTSEGRARTVFSGYRPAYAVREDYSTSTHHEFLDQPGASTGESVRANVWLLTPDVYPGTLWTGRVVKVLEGPKVVGTATILHVFNPVLLSGGT